MYVILPHVYSECMAGGGGRLRVAVGTRVGVQRRPTAIWNCDRGWVVAKFACPSDVRRRRLCYTYSMLFRIHAAEESRRSTSRQAPAHRAAHPDDGPSAYSRRSKLQRTRAPPHAAPNRQRLHSTRDVDSTPVLRSPDTAHLHGRAAGGAQSGLRVASLTDRDPAPCLESASHRSPGDRNPHSPPSPARASRVRRRRASLRGPFTKRMRRGWKPSPPPPASAHALPPPMQRYRPLSLLPRLKVPAQTMRDVERGIARTRSPPAPAPSNAATRRRIPLLQPMALCAAMYAIARVEQSCACRPCPAMPSMSREGA